MKNVAGGGGGGGGEKLLVENSGDGDKGRVGDDV